MFIFCISLEISGKVSESSLSSDLFSIDPSELSPIEQNFLLRFRIKFDNLELRIAEFNHIFLEQSRS